MEMFMTMGKWAEQNPNAVDFLWSVGLGITFTDAIADCAKAMEQCAKAAYRDLARTLNYAITTEELGKMKEDDARRKGFADLKETFYIEVVNEIVDRIHELLEENPPDFETWHKDVCGKIVALATTDRWDRANGHRLFEIRDKSRKEDKQKYKAVGEAEAFFYGQAQKWLNMTLKNMLTMGLWNDKMAKIKPHMHVPVDSYIIEAAGGEKEGTAKNPIFLRTKEKIQKSSSWSSWNEEDYGKFQQIIREELTEGKKKELEEKFNREIKHPIDWEHYAWLEIANRRRGSD